MIDPTAVQYQAVVIAHLWREYTPEATAEAMGFKIPWRLANELDKLFLMLREQNS